MEEIICQVKIKGQMTAPYWYFSFYMILQLKDISKKELEWYRGSQSITFWCSCWHWQCKFCVTSREAIHDLQEYVTVAKWKFFKCWTITYILSIVATTKQCFRFRSSRTRFTVAVHTMPSCKYITSISAALVSTSAWNLLLLKPKM